MRGGPAEISRSFGSVPHAGRNLWRNCINSGIAALKKRCTATFAGNGAGGAAPPQPPRARAGAESPAGRKRPRTRVRSERPLRAGPGSSFRTQLLAFSFSCRRALGFKPHSPPRACAGFPGSAEIKAAVSGISRLRGNKCGCFSVCSASLPAICLLWGAEDAAGEVPVCAIPGCPKHPPNFSNASALSRYFAKGARCGPSPAPALITVGRGKTFPSPQKRRRRRTRSAPCNSRGHRGTAGRDGQRETRETREVQEGPGPPRRPYPAPGRQLLPAGHMHMDAGHMDVGRTRTAGTQGTRGGGRAGAAAGSGGRESSLPAGNEGVALLGACWGETQSVGRCHPAPDKARHRRCHSPGAFGLSHSDSNSHPEPRRRQDNAYILPEGCPDRQPRGDSGTIPASDGFSRPFPHAWSPAMSS